MKHGNRHDRLRDALFGWLVGTYTDEELHSLIREKSGSNESPRNEMFGFSDTNRISFERSGPAVISSR